MYSCNNEENGLVIYKGADATFDVQLMDENNNFYDLTGTTDIKAIFKSTSGVLEVDFLSGVSVPVPATNGKVRIALSEANTETLSVGKLQSIELEITSNSGLDTKIVQLLKILEVKARLFS